MFSLRVRPRFFAQIFASESVGFAKKERVKIFTRREWSLGHGACLSAMFDWPFVRERIHDSAVARGETKSRHFAITRPQIQKIETNDGEDNVRRPGREPRLDTITFAEGEK